MKKDLTLLGNEGLPVFVLKKSELSKINGNVKTVAKL
jgi:hypothetical protein